ncbi:MAG: nucleotidyltransferase domain-containing protein [Promethearchaeati archaeon]|jgi:predicted nucleotidyltransferase
MNINILFSSNERVRILNEIIFSDFPLSVSKTAKNLKLSKALVSKYFNLLVSGKVLKRHKNQFIVLDNSLVRSIKIFLNINQFKPSYFKKFDFIKGVGLYGSCVKGTNHENSDIDLWIKIKKTDEIELAKFTNELKRKDNKIKPLFLTKDKINRLKKEDKIFYNSLFFGSVILYGEDIEV